MTVPADGAVTDVAVDAGRTGQPVLDASDAAELASLGRSVEQVLGGPQDLEWGSVDGRFFLLQARPVTASGGGFFGDDWPALDDRPTQPFDVWTLANVGEEWPEPVSPLVASVVPLVIGGAVRSALRGVDPKHLDGIQWAKRLYGRVYYNEGALKHVLTEELGLPASLLDRSRGNRHTTPDGDRVHPLRLMRKLPIIGRLAVRQRQVGRETEEFVRKADRWVAAFDARPTPPRSDQETWDEGQVWFERMLIGFNLQNEMSGLALATLGTLETLLKRWLDRPGVATALVTGVGDVQAAQMGVTLSRLAAGLRDLGLTEVLEDEPAETLARLRADPRARPALEILDEFLVEHGHRCANEAEWLHPRWHEAPEQVLVLAAAYLRPDFVGPRERALVQRRHRQQAVVLVEEQLGPLRRMIVRRVMTRAQNALRLRDNGKGAAMKASFPARRLTASLGERWADRGWLAEPDDIFFVTFPEIERVIVSGDPRAAGVDLRSAVAARRRALAHWRTVSSPEVLGADGQRLGSEPTTPTVDRRLHGIPASHGRVRGTARLLSDPHDAVRLGRSDILVTRATDVGWSVAFPLIGGLVTEIGGQLSHAAILAREYGLAAVVNVAGATDLIGDGQTIVIDGSAGTIEFENVEPRQSG